MEDNTVAPFEGFSHPDDVPYTRIPNNWFNECARIKNLAELKVILYVMRNTWGYQEYDEPKRISLDEFSHGRRRRNSKKDDKRLDSGTGLGLTAVKDGIRRAIEDGYLICEVDNSDLGRIQKCYSLKMREVEEN